MGGQFSDQYIQECKKTRHQDNVNFTTNKLTITGGDNVILILAHRSMAARCPGDLEKCSLGRIFHSHSPCATTAQQCKEHDSCC